MSLESGPNPELPRVVLTPDWLLFRESANRSLLQIQQARAVTHEIRGQIHELEFQRVLFESLLTSGHDLDDNNHEVQIHRTAQLYSFQIENREFSKQLRSLQGIVDALKMEFAKQFSDDPEALPQINPVHCILNFDLCGSTPAMSALAQVAGLTLIEDFKTRFFGEIRSRMRVLNLLRNSRIDTQEGDGATVIFASMDDALSFVQDFSEHLRRENGQFQPIHNPRLRWYRFGACSERVLYTLSGATSEGFSPANRLQSRSAPGALLIDDHTYRGFAREASRQCFKRIETPVTGKRTDGKSILTWFAIIDPNAAPEAMQAGRWSFDPQQCAIPRQALHLDSSDS